MASDQQVNAKTILQTLLEVERQGGQTMERLEQVEPDLACFVMERLGDIHHKLLALRGRPKATQAVYHRIELLVLVSINALRTSHYELWRSMQAESPLAQIDPSLSAHPPKPEEHDGP
jgi:hypothetical protein